MKKVLLASTAVIAFAGAASADVALSGLAEIGVVGGDRFGNETQFWTSIDVTFTLSGETDSGITFGASVDLDEADNINGDQADNVAIFVSGEFGTLTLGDTDGAYDWALSEAGSSSPGSISDSETEHAGYSGNSGLDGTFDGQIMRYNYSFGDFAVAGSLELDDTSDSVIYGIGARYTFAFSGGSATFGVGYQQDSDVDDRYVVGISGDVTLDSGFRVTAFYGEGDFSQGTVDGETEFGIGAGYEFDAITVHLNYGYVDDNGFTDEGIGFAAAYDLGGGLSAHFGYGNSFGDSGDADDFSLGLSMSF